MEVNLRGAYDLDEEDADMIAVVVNHVLVEFLDLAVNMLHERHGDGAFDVNDLVDVIEDITSTTKLAVYLDTGSTRVH